jgi:hypothetical protein
VGGGLLLLVPEVVAAGVTVGELCLGIHVGRECRKKGVCVCRGGGGVADNRGANGPTFTGLQPRVAEAAVVVAERCLAGGRGSSGSGNGLGAGFRQSWASAWLNAVPDDGLWCCLGPQGMQHAGCIPDHSRHHKGYQLAMTGHQGHYIGSVPCYQDWMPAILTLIAGEGQGARLLSAVGSGARALDGNRGTAQAM